MTFRNESADSSAVAPEVVKPTLTRGPGGPAARAAAAAPNSEGFHGAKCEDADDRDAAARGPTERFVRDLSCVLQTDILSRKKSAEVLVRTQGVRVEKSEPFRPLRFRAVAPEFSVSLVSLAFGSVFLQFPQPCTLP